MPDSIGGFDWDPGNRGKCRKHGVALADIEALFRRPLAIHPARFGSKEERFIAIGSTAEGRNVLVVFTLRKRGATTLIRPISARYMHLREVAYYEKAAKTEK
jgi:uncharacterized DUF497 family protein